MPLTVEDCGILASCLVQWVCDDTNQKTMQVAINEAVTAYANQYDRRQFPFGHPVQNAQPLSTFSGACSRLFNSGVSVVAAGMSYAMSEGSKDFCEKFPTVDASSAQIAFLYLSKMKSDWKAEAYWGMSRPSFTTRIFASVFNAFVHNIVYDQLRFDNDADRKKFKNLMRSSDLCPMNIPVQAEVIFTAFTNKCSENIKQQLTDYLRNAEFIIASRPK